MAAATPRAGDLRDRYRFEQRALDDNGDRLGNWGDGSVEAAAQTTALKGGEGVLEQRLQGSQPYLLTVRAWSATKAITNAWRAVDVRDPNRVFNITSATLTSERAFVEILCVQKTGQASG